MNGDPPKVEFEMAMQGLHPIQVVIVTLICIWLVCVQIRNIVFLIGATAWYLDRRTRR